MHHSTQFGLSVASGSVVTQVPTAPPAPLALQAPAPAPPRERPARRRVIIIDSPVPSYSAESPTLLLAEHLSRRGAGVDVLTGLDVLPDVRASGAEPDSPSGAASGPARQVALPPYPRTHGLNADHPDPHSPDLVIAMSGPDGDATAAARLARRTGARLLVVVTGLQTSTPEHVAEVLRSADRLTAPGQAFRQALTALGIDDARICVLPTWSQSAPSWLDRTDARRRLGWPERGFIAVHSGPMTADGGLEQLVDAADLLGPECLVALTGDGPHRPVVEDRAAAVPNALVPPPMDADRRALSHVAADVLLVTEPARSPRLTLPLELARCLAAGRPVVAAAPVSGTLAAELDRAGGAGLVVPPDDPARIAGALLALHADPSHRVAMGLTAIAYAEAHLSRDTVLTRLDRVVDAALA